MQSKRIEESKQALENLKTMFPDAVGACVRKEDLVNTGNLFWPWTYKLAKDDDEANLRANDYVRYLAITDPMGAVMLAESFKVPDQALIMFGSARWVDQGLPVIRLGHKRAAALMATVITKQSVEYVKPPFKAFYIELPDGLLSLRDHDGTDRKASGILVHAIDYKTDLTREDGSVLKAGMRWRYVVLTNTELLQWQLNRTTADLAGLEHQDNDWIGIGLPIEDYDKRVAALVGRLICAVCLMMSSPENVKEQRKPNPRNKSAKRKTPDAPSYRVFVEGKPIDVDVRPAIAAYLRGERDSPHVRLLVAGHYKPNLGARLGRVVWVEPYWRGGIDGDPIRTRTHDAGDKA